MTKKGLAALIILILLLVGSVLQLLAFLGFVP